ncbi:MAG: ATP-binding protein [Planctomycetota bacterium]|jgi:anti-sigma regulatory factor (Ser/Thr protein kinase)
MADIISRRDIAGKIAEVTGLPKEEVEQVLRVLGPSIAEALADGREVRFPRLVRFLVREKPRDAAVPLPLMATPAQQMDVVAQVSTLFREQVLGPVVPRVIALLLPETGAELAGILEKLGGEGLCEAKVVETLSALEAALKEKPSEFLILGEQISAAEYRYMAHEIKMHPDRVRTIIIRIAAKDSDPYAVDTLTLIPDEVIEQPMDREAVEALLREALRPPDEEKTEYLHQLAIRIPSNDGMTEAAMEVLDRLGSLTPVGDRRLAELMPAVREAVEAAIRVGNESDPTKYVDITFLVDDEKIAVVVKDEGPVPQEKREWAGAREGSGIASMIMKKGADEVEYLPPGNRVMLTKYY